MIPRPVACLLMVLSAVPARAEVNLACPASLAVTSTMADLPDWRTLNTAPARLPLERIAIRPAPDSSASMPQTGFLRLEQGDRKTFQASWDLAEARRAHPELWLTCFYTGTTLALARKLPAEVGFCEFRVESSADSLRESAICR